MYFPSRKFVFYVVSPFKQICLLPILFCIQNRQSNMYQIKVSHCKNATVKDVIMVFSSSRFPKKMLPQCKGLQKSYLGPTGCCIFTVRLKALSRATLQEIIIYVMCCQNKIMIYTNYVYYENTLSLSFIAFKFFLRSQIFYYIISFLWSKK